MAWAWRLWASMPRELLMIDAAPEQKAIWYRRSRAGSEGSIWVALGASGVSMPGDLQAQPEICRIDTRRVVESLRLVREIGTVAGMSTVVSMPARRGLVAVIAENVRVACARLGWSQSDLARALRVSTSTVNSKWRGATPWTLDQLEEVAEALDTPVQGLLKYTARDLNPEPADVVEALVIDLFTRARVA